MAARISLMYRKSGGCDRFHKCKDCGYLMFIKCKNRKRYKCLKYGDGGLEDFSSDWHPENMACKFWTEKATISIGKHESEDELEGQMTLDDFGI